MEKAAYIIYLTMLVVAVLLFGAVHTFAYTFVFLGVLTGALLLVATNIKKSSSPEKKYTFLWVKAGMNPLFFFFLALLLLQMTPLPDWLLLKLSPESKAVWNHSLPAASSLLQGANQGLWFTLAPYVYPVRMSLVRWIVYFLFFIGLVQTLNSRKRIEAAVILILALGCFEVLYGIVQTFSGMNNIWWYQVGHDAHSIKGTYLNRNHFAGFMEMGIVLAAAYAGASVDGLRKKTSLVVRKNDLKAKFLKSFSGERAYTKPFLIIFAGTIMGTGLILSASRGGMIATAVALLVMGLLFFFRKKQRKKGALILALFLLTSIYALVAGIDHAVDRFKTFYVTMEERGRHTQKTTVLFNDYQMAGVGAGNFEYAFPKYQDPKDIALFLDYTHNDWIQLLAETGVAGFVLLFAGMGYFLFVYVRRWLEREDSFAVCLGIAPLGALAALAVHSYSDFNLHRPANFLLLTAIIAIGGAVLHLEGRHQRETANLPCARLALRGPGGPALALLLVLILWSGVWTVRHFVAEAHCNTLARKSLNLDDHPPVEFIQTAMRWDNGNAAYSFKLAGALMQIRDKEAQAADADRMKWQQSHEPIIAAMERAMRLNPLNAEYHVRLGWEYSYMTHEPDYMNKWLPAADLSMERATYAAGNGAKNPRLQIDMGHYWTMRSRTLGTTGDPREDPAWTKALWHYHRAQELMTGKATGKEIMQYVKIFYPDDDRLAQVLKE
jgi:O-antigen ligase